MTSNDIMKRVNEQLEGLNLNTSANDESKAAELQVVGKKEPGPLYNLKDKLVTECEKNGYDAESVKAISSDWKKGYIFPEAEGRKITREERAEMLTGKNTKEVEEALQKIDEIENPLVAWEKQMYEDLNEAVKAVSPYKEALEAEYNMGLEKLNQIRQLVNDLAEDLTEKQRRLGIAQEKTEHKTRTEQPKTEPKTEQPKTETRRRVNVASQPKNDKVKSRGRRRSDNPLTGNALATAEDFIIDCLLEGYQTVFDIREKGANEGLGNEDQIGDAFFDLVEKIKENKGITLNVSDEEGNVEEQDFIYRFYPGNKNVALLPKKGKK